MDLLGKDASKDLHRMGLFTGRALFITDACMVTINFCDYMYS